MSNEKGNREEGTASDGRRKTAVVTGASGGMGKATAAALAGRHGMKVYMLVRSEERGRRAVEDIRRRHPEAELELVVGDLGSLSSVRAVAEALKARCDRIDVLVNNAGVVTVKREETEDGFERMMGVNHLGHFVLTGLLLPLLEAGPEGRIVVVSSGAHKIGRMDYGDPQLRRGFTVWGGYGRSKLANVWFARALATRLKGSKATVNALHPGAVSTDIGVNRQTGFGRAVHKLLKPFFLSAEEGADTAIYLATAAEAAGRSGEYYYRRKPARVSARAADAAEAERFWAWSEETTGFRWGGAV